MLKNIHDECPLAGEWMPVWFLVLFLVPKTSEDVQTTKLTKLPDYTKYLPVVMGAAQRPN
jgi:hypothetical protein